MRVWLAMGLMTGLAACAVSPEMGDAAPEVVVLPEIQTPAPPPGARRVDEFDTTTQAQRSAALKTSEGGVLLGEAVLSLGDPGRAGFWIETALVTSPGQGRVTLREGDNSVEVALLPGIGSGRISLATMRLLEVSLTDLVNANIYEYQ